MPPPAPAPPGAAPRGMCVPRPLPDLFPGLPQGRGGSAGGTAHVMGVPPGLSKKMRDLKSFLVKLAFSSSASPGVFFSWQEKCSEPPQASPEVVPTSIPGILIPHSTRRDRGDSPGSVPGATAASQRPEKPGLAPSAPSSRWRSCLCPSSALRAQQRRFGDNPRVPALANVAFQRDRGAGRENFPSAAHPASASLGSPPAAPRARQDLSLLGGNAHIIFPIEKKKRQKSAVFHE